MVQVKVLYEMWSIATINVKIMTSTIHKLSITNESTRKTMGLYDTSKNELSREDEREVQDIFVERAPAHHSVTLWLGERRIKEDIFFFFVFSFFLFSFCSLKIKIPFQQHRSYPIIIRWCPSSFPVPHATLVMYPLVGLAVPVTIKRYQHIESLTSGTQPRDPSTIHGADSSLSSSVLWSMAKSLADDYARIFHSQPKFGTRSVQVSRQNRRLHIDHRVYHSVSGRLEYMYKEKDGEENIYLRVFWSLNNDAGAAAVSPHFNYAAHPTVLPYTFKLLSLSLSLSPIRALYLCALPSRWFNLAQQPGGITW